MPYWGIFGLGFENNIFGLEFENNIVIFELSNLGFVYLQNFGKKWKCLSLGPNMPYLGIFCAGILNKYYHIWNQHPRICLIAKICEKMKMTKFGTKNALFGYFWVRILKNYCRNWNQHLRICQTVKFCEKMKMPKFWTKNVSFGYFGCRILKKLLSYLKSAPPNLSIWKIWEKNKTA